MKLSPVQISCLKVFIEAGGTKVLSEWHRRGRVTVRALVKRKLLESTSLVREYRITEEGRRWYEQHKNSKY